MRSLFAFSSISPATSFRATSNAVADRIPAGAEQGAEDRHTRSGLVREARGGVGIAVAAPAADHDRRGDRPQRTGAVQIAGQHVDEPLAP